MIFKLTLERFNDTLTYEGILIFGWVPSTPLVGRLVVEKLMTLTICSISTNTAALYKPHK